MARRSERKRPKVKYAERKLQHSYGHRGDTGKYGNIYNVNDVSVWKPDAGEHELCIIPYQVTDPKDSLYRTKNPDLNPPFTEEEIKEDNCWDHKLTVLIHTNIGVNQDAVVCPRTFREACPICEERDRLIKADAEDREIGALSPMKRAVYNIFCFDSQKEMEKGVQIWEAPHQSIEDTLSELYRDKRTGELRVYTVPEEGWNVFFERKGTGLNTEYRQVSIVERRKEDEFTEKELDELYEQAYNLEEIIEVKSYDELYKMFHGSFAMNEEDNEEEEKPSRFSRFRGRRAATEEEDEAAVEEEKEERPRGRGQSRRKKEEEDELIIPEKYEECFGIQNQELEECDDCPQEVWEACLEKCEERVKERSKSRRGRR